MMDNFNETITLTFCESGENHVGMEMLGNKASLGEGFNLEDLLYIKNCFEQQEISCQLFHLNKLIDKDEAELEPAYVLVMREGVKYFGVDLNGLKEELTLFEWDRK